MSGHINAASSSTSTNTNVNNILRNTAEASTSNNQQISHRNSSEAILTVEELEERHNINLSSNFNSVDANLVIRHGDNDSVIESDSSTVASTVLSEGDQSLGVFANPKSVQAAKHDVISRELTKLRGAIVDISKNSRTVQDAADASKQLIRRQLRVVAKCLEALQGTNGPDTDPAARESNKAKALDVLYLAFKNARALGLQPADMSKILDYVLGKVVFGYRKREHTNIFQGTESFTTHPHWHLCTQKKAVQLLVKFAVKANRQRPDIYTMPLFDLLIENNLNPSSGNRAVDVEGALVRKLEKTIADYPVALKMTYKDLIVGNHKNFSDKPPAGHSNITRGRVTSGIAIGDIALGGITAVPLIHGVSAAATALIWPVGVAIGGIGAILVGVSQYQKMRNMFRGSSQDRVVTNVLMKAPLHGMNKNDAIQYYTQLKNDALNLDVKYQAGLIKLADDSVAALRQQLDDAAL